MGKRFAGPSLRKRIQYGLIGSIEELKAEFKTAAKRTHPDLAGSDAAEEFVRLRRDYESALRSLTADDRRTANSGPSADPRAYGEDYGDSFAALEVLLKRDFPKRPRHDKERERYAYARIRARAALSVLGNDAENLFDEAEGELLALKEKDSGDFRATMRLFADIVSAKLDGTESLVSAVRMELGRRSAATALGDSPARPAENRPLGTAVSGFLRLLVES